MLAYLAVIAREPEAVERALREDEKASAVLACDARRGSCLRDRLLLRQLAGNLCGCGDKFLGVSSNLMPLN